MVHERLSPKRHRFRYRLFFLDIDLEELPTLSERILLFSHNRANLYSFRDSDHLDLGQPGGLRANLTAWLERKGIQIRSGDRIRLVTLPRILGYMFNPVCFYFIYSGNRPARVVVEVTNTFHELKPYLIESQEAPGSFRLITPKHFYVSPFSGVDAEFDFRVRFPGDQIEIHIDDRENGKTTLVSWIRGKRQPLTNTRLAWYSLRYPALTLQVIFKIHWQAFRLWLKNLPVSRKAADPDLQRDLYRPHSSLTQPPNK